MAVDVGTPVFAGRLHAEHAPHVEHLTERSGLLTIVVLGETIVGVVNGIVGESWTPSVLAVGFSGLGVAFAVWWIYFDCLGGGAVERLARHGDTVRYQTWLYSHLPLQLCLAGLGVSVEAMIRHVGGGPAPPFVLWLTAGAFAGVYFSLTVMHWIGGEPTRWTRWMAGARLLGAVSPLAVVAIGAGHRDRGGHAPRGRRLRGPSRPPHPTVRLGERPTCPKGANVHQSTGADR